MGTPLPPKKGTSLYRNASFDARIVNQNRYNGCRELAIFRYFHNVSTILGAQNWTTHEDYMVVFIVVQNLVRIDKVGLILRNVSLFWLENAYSGPQNWSYGGFLPSKWGGVTKR